MIKDMSSLWVVTPVYYDTQSLHKLRANILNEVEKKFYFKKINFVVVDDTAGVDDQIKKINWPNFYLVTPPFNLGHQRTIVYGLRHIIKLVNDRDIIITLDSDGEDRPEDLPRMLDAYKEEKGQKYIFAQRRKRKEGMKFKICYQFFKIFFYLMTGNIIRTGNYILSSANSLKKIIEHPYFDLCYSSTFMALKIPKRFVSCDRGNRYFGKSQMNFSSLIQHGIRMLMPFNNVIAIRFLILFGMIFSFSVMMTVGIVGLKLLYSYKVPTWASILSTATLSISFLSLGNLFLIFSNFSQSNGVGLAKLDICENTDVKNEKAA